MDKEERFKVERFLPPLKFDEYDIGEVAEDIARLGYILNEINKLHSNDVRRKLTEEILKSVDELASKTLDELLGDENGA